MYCKNSMCCLILALCMVVSGMAMADTSAGLGTMVTGDTISDALEIYQVDKEKLYTVNSTEHTIGGAFQPSVVMDGQGRIHVFFQARLNSSDDRAPKLIAHVISEDYGATFSEPVFVYEHPLQTYAMSPFLRTSESGGERISLLTSVSMDETLDIHKTPDSIKEVLGIDMGRFQRKAAALILEFYSDDGGATWSRKEHYDVTDRVYKRNGKDFYVAFMNLIGQVRRIDAGPHAGRLILAGPIRGDYLPAVDHPRFREYSPSSTIIFSDDNGESWQFGGIIADEKTAFEFNEASAVPVNDGKRLLMVRRANARNAPGKMMHYSDDGGASWGAGILTTIDSTRCLQVLEKCNDIVMCSSPGHKMRSRGQIYMSRDDGKTWSKKQIEEKLFSYSTVQHLTGDYYMCAWSRGHHGEIGIAAKVFSGDWLETE